MGQIPPQSSPGLPQIKEPNVYFGSDEDGFVVANTKQLEVDYQQANGDNVESHYSGTGGVALSSIFKRAAFALRLGDLNLLISSQITDQSRIMFVRDPVAMAQKAAPFITFNQSPYAVITKSGHIDWVVDGYTTTSNYAYSQNADTQQVAVGSSLPSSYNYVRNSVKVVIDAYSGKMTFYDADPKDPILEAYEAAFPHMFTPISKMPAELQAHLRYPPDIFSIQSAIYGRYHLTEPGRASTRRATPGSCPRRRGPGPSPRPCWPRTRTTHRASWSRPTPARMAPQYQVYALPNTSKQVFTVSDAFVPAAQGSLTNNNQNFNLTAWMVGQSDPGHYGAARRLRDAARDVRSGQRGRGDLGQHDRVVGHFAAGPERVRGAAGRDADGADRQLHGVPAADVRVAGDQPPAPAQVRGGGAGQGRPGGHVDLGGPGRHSRDRRHAALDRGCGEQPGLDGRHGAGPGGGRTWRRPRPTTRMRSPR